MPGCVRIASHGRSSTSDVSSKIIIHTFACFFFFYEPANASFISIDTFMFSTKNRHKLCLHRQMPPLVFRNENPIPVLAVAWSKIQHHILTVSTLNCLIEQALESVRKLTEFQLS